MMKQVLLSAAFALLAACAGSDSKGDTANSNTPVEKGTSCELEIALECEEGFVDACLLTPQAASTHTCVEGSLDEPEETPVDQPEETEEGAEETTTEEPTEE